MIIIFGMISGVCQDYFQDMIHSGINAYLTLHLAQILLYNNNLILLSGIPETWLKPGTIKFGPVLTEFGKICITININADEINLD
jgi:hypothetical protein